MFIIFILSRVLFVASMVFIIGYVFGSFSKSKMLTRITKVATILAIVLFVAGNVFVFRGGRPNGRWQANNSCYSSHADSTIIRN